MLLFVPPDRHEEVRQSLNHLIHVPFKFDFTGSQIIYFHHEEDYSKLEEELAGQQIVATRELSAITRTPRRSGRKEAVRLAVP